MLTGGHPRVLVGDYFQNQTKKRKPLTSVSYSHLRGKDQSPVPHGYSGDNPNVLLKNPCRFHRRAKIVQIERNTKQKSLFLFLFPRCSLLSTEGQSYTIFPKPPKQYHKIREICGICATKKASPLHFRRRRLCINRTGGLCPCVN